MVFYGKFFQVIRESGVNLRSVWAQVSHRWSFRAFPIQGSESPCSVHSTPHHGTLVSPLGRKHISRGHVIPYTCSLDQNFLRSTRYRDLVACLYSLHVNNYIKYYVKVLVLRTIAKDTKCCNRSKFQHLNPLHDRKKTFQHLFFVRKAFFPSKNPRSASLGPDFDSRFIQ